MRTPRATDTDGLSLGDLAAGARIGEYKIERQLATRGTGHLYEATHAVLPRRVQIKVMPAMGIELLREACIVEAIDHPGVPRIYECGLMPDHRSWIATEMIEGITLASRDELTIGEVVALVRDIAEILEAAHARGLVHRNITPLSIVFPMSRRFPVCLVDWSGARTRDSRTPVPLLGHAYSAPERVIDERADIYSLGVITHQLLRRFEKYSRPPILEALVKTMTATDLTARPSATSVREHGAWLAYEIAQSVPELVDDLTTDVVSRIVTSESAPTISGEIKPRRET
jgi:serine/threonine protein kinase